MNPNDAFREAMLASGLTAPDTIEADGKFHRFSSSGKRRDDAGWYVLNSDGIAAGAFGDWRTGLSERWRVHSGYSLTERERAEQRAKFDSRLTPEVSKRGPGRPRKQPTK